MGHCTVGAANSPTSLPRNRGKLSTQTWQLSIGWHGTQWMRDTRASTVSRWDSHRSRALEGRHRRTTGGKGSKMQICSNAPPPTRQNQEVCQLETCAIALPRRQHQEVCHGKTYILAPPPTRHHLRVCHGKTFTIAPPPTRQHREVCQLEASAFAQVWVLAPHR